MKEINRVHLNNNSVYTFVLIINPFRGAEVKSHGSFIQWFKNVLYVSRGNLRATSFWPGPLRVQGYWPKVATKH